ncbi:uncharacterized protein LOC124535949 [Vanessa cardui]|uniref:uncharacterized protein LOC124535949 n=1 Tax=Vanessa cardui TaxID=171605 RepID=UPI001F147AAB|nr:uncharacterized protein LOC124535949 [Vanessa cardui]
MNIFVLYLGVFINVCICDFYVGMFKKNDFLIAQDRLYKERIPYRSIYAKYGRIFKCPITYFRVVDRLGIGRGPGVEIIRGGLGQKYLVLRLKSPYNCPISVNIYIGCANNMPIRALSHTSKSTTISASESTKSIAGSDSSPSSSTAKQSNTNDTTINPAPANNSTS